MAPDGCCQRPHPPKLWARGSLSGFKSRSPPPRGEIGLGGGGTCFICLSHSLSCGKWVEPTLPTLLGAGGLVQGTQERHQ